MRGRFLHRQPPPGSRVDTQHPLGHGCVGWWEANMGSGLVVPDISGQNNHGTMTNMDAATDWVQGRYEGEGALEFDGVNDYIYIGDKDVFSFGDGAGNDSSFSITLWLKPNTPDAYQMIVSKYIVAPAKREYRVQLLAGNIQLQLFNYDSYSNRIGRSYNTALSTGAWHHVVATYDGSKTEAGIKLYVGGVRRDDTSGTVGAYTGMTNGSAPLTVGIDSNETSSPFAGLISHAAIYSRALSASEIADLNANPYAPLWTPGERKWWWMGAAGGGSIIGSSIIGSSIARSSIILPLPDYIRRR